MEPLRILLLGHDAPAVERLTRALEEAGIPSRLEQAATRQEFMSALERERPDVILGDDVPGLPGRAALDVARQRWPAVPFVIVTGSTGDEATVRALLAGALAALRASEERFRALVENSLDATVMVDAQGRVLYASPSIQRIIGFRPDERVGRVIFDLVHPDEVEDARRVVARCAASPGAPVRAVVRVRHRDGHWADVECTAANHLDNPAIGAIVINYHDVSEQRRLEEMLRQAQKMEAVGRVAGGIAHDFNNLLGVTLGYSDLILRRMGEQDPLRPKVLEIRKAAERAGSLTRQLMSFARPRAPRREPLDVAIVVADMAEMLRRVLGEDVQLVLRADEGAVVRADRAQLGQVLMNLAVNARDAMPRGGKLIIECRHVDLEQPTSIQQTAAAGPCVLLRVTDTGLGMEPEVRQRVFEPFYTTKPSGQGTGLGLAMVYGIVTQAGGHITVHSEPGRGASFEIYLPRATPTDEAAGGEAATTAPSTDAAGGGSETVLLVEDAEPLRRLAHEVLESAGYKVLEASSGEEALRLAGADQASIDLLLTDIVMPDMTGRELAAGLRARGPRLRVVFMSGYSGEAAVQSGELTPESRFLQKPFSADQLLRALRQALDQPSPAG